MTGMLRVQVDSHAMGQFTKDALGRFANRKANGERVFKKLAKEVQQQAVRNLVEESNRTIASAHSRTDFPFIHKRTGRLEAAIASPDNVSVNSLGFSFMDPRYLSGKTRYWRAIEEGTTAHVGRRLTITPTHRFSTSSGGRGQMLIRRPIKAHDYAAQAWNQADLLERAEWLFNEIYPGFRIR